MNSATQSRCQCPLVGAERIKRGALSALVVDGRKPAAYARNMNTTDEVSDLMHGGLRSWCHKTRGCWLIMYENLHSIRRVQTVANSFAPEGVERPSDIPLMAGSGRFARETLPAISTTQTS